MEENTAHIEDMPAAGDGSNICVLVSQLSFGGAERQTTILLEQLALRYGIRPLVCCMSPVLEPFGQRIRAAGCELVHWKRAKSYEVGRVFYLRQMLRRRRVELIHAVHYQAVAYGWLARVGMPGVAFVPSIRSTVYDPSLRKRAFYRFVLPRCPVVVANSMSGKQWLQEFYGVPEARTHVVYNGLDPGLIAAAPDRTAVRAQLRIPESAPVIAFVGKTTRQKGVELLARIFSRVLEQCPQAHLLLMGTGLTREWALDTFPSMPMVHALGPRTDIYDLVGTADCLLLTSSTEGFPNAVLEAMVLGVPPVTTRVGECPILIDHGKDGFLFDYGNDEEGAALVLQILKDPALAQEMSHRARAKTLERYGTDAMVEATVKVYERALGRAVRPAWPLTRTG